MEVSNEKLREYTRRLMISRMRLLLNNGFYGLLLMHMRMNISDEHDTAWSDLQDRLYFNPDFLEQVSDRELDYVLMHLLMHVVLKHLSRKGDFETEYYDEAADIVVNSNILRSSGGDLTSISLANFDGVQKHLAPGGDDGWKYSVEEIYQMLRQVLVPDDTNSDESDEKNDENEENNDESDQSSKEDKSDEKSDEDHESGALGLGGDFGDYGDNNKGGGAQKGKPTFGNNKSKNGKDEEATSSGWDYHNRESEIDTADQNLQDQIWQERIMQAASAIQKRNSAKQAGLIPAFAERYLDELKKPQTDWRTVLDEFIQEEINDYSFCPPDRRFDDSPFFLPDFNEKDLRVEKVLFMIDTSGSMSDDEILQCYSEIKGAIDQFNGKLEGWLGFFDAAVVEPKPFMDEDEFIAIRPEGGGGTRFDIIFDYVMENMQDDLPVSIVILTDGYADFPKESDARGIPVLWIIDNEEVDPPWGKVTRIDVSE